MSERIHAPAEYPFGVNIPTMQDKHLDVLINGYMRRNAKGERLSDRDRACFQALMAEKDTRRARKSLPRTLEMAG